MNTFNWFLGSGSVKDLIVMVNQKSRIGRRYSKSAVMNDAGTKKLYFFLVWWGVCEMNRGSQ